MATYYPAANLVPYPYELTYDGATINAYAEISFPADIVAMVSCGLPAPVAGHKYYGTVDQQRPAGHMVSDGRFEYYTSDSATGKMTFAEMSQCPADGQWHRQSAILSLAAPASGEWSMRCFTVGGSATSKRRNLAIIDLTAAYGAGNEPDKDWCDTHLPVFGAKIVIPHLRPGDIINCPYSGGEVPITLPKGTFKLECWGARGGAYSRNAYSYGGYSVGTYSSYSNIILHLVCGGAGAPDVAGYNGGGNGGGSSYNGGGGATHIGLKTGLLTSYESDYASKLIMVAGGAGGSTGTNSNDIGGAGGGQSGGDGTGSNNDYGYGATQTQGGNGASQGSSGHSATSGTFGQGGNSYTREGASAGAGGGGFYGGGGSWSWRWGIGSVNYYGSGGGGSGYVNTSLLTNTSTTQETTSTNPDTTNYAGYIRITVIDVRYFNVPVKVNGSWKQSEAGAVKVGGVWKNIAEVFTKVGGVWKGGG